MEDKKDGAAVPLSTAEYAMRRHDPELRHCKTAFREFCDDTGDFEQDLQRAMSGNSWRGPAFTAFKQAVMEGRLFAIVTARGHGEETLRRATDRFIHKILSEDEMQTMMQSLRAFCEFASEDAADASLFGDYLKLCHFVGVSSPEFIKSSGISRVEEGKKYAIRKFVDCIVKINQEAFRQKGKAIASISFGMSDDDHKNVETVDALMRDELSPLHARVKFVVFDTGVGGGKVRRLKPHVSDPDLQAALNQSKNC